MALLASLDLNRLPALVRRGEPVESRPVLPIGLPELDALLPDGGLPRGGVTELAVSGGAALSTAIALAACRSAQAEAMTCSTEGAWCAFIDPSGSLYGPGVSAAGVERERLLVVRPNRDALERTAIRLAESHAFSVIVIDAVGVPGASLAVPLGNWLRVVRRLSLALDATGTCVLLVTDGEARRPLPLPVALRLELTRESFDRVSVKIGKERRGRVSGPRVVVVNRGPENGTARPKTLGLIPLESSRSKSGDADRELVPSRDEQREPLRSLIGGKAASG